MVALVFHKINMLFNYIEIKLDKNDSRKHANANPAFLKLSSLYQTLLTVVSFRIFETYLRAQEAFLTYKLQAK